jgi:enoyl-[acyl-carrier protein] reductase I
MGLLEGKNALVFGLANERSIAWGITQAFHREGANIGISYAGEALERRVKPLAEKVDCKWVEECDVTKDEMIAAVAEKAAAHFVKIDILVHSIAFAGREELSRPYYQTSREGFKNAMDISVFSFVALTNAFLPILNPSASIMCLTYGSGATKVAPHYNVMGVAKAALEASVRYLAADFGVTDKKIRVNAISAGPIRTLSMAGIAGSRSLMNMMNTSSLLKRGVSIEDVGNSAAYLCSDFASGVTGEIHYVDSGFNASIGAIEFDD